MADEGTQNTLEGAGAGAQAAQTGASSSAADDGPAGPTVAEITATHNAQMAAALDATRAALQAANADLPTSVFEGADLNTLTGSVASARAIADHVKALPAGPPTPGVTPPLAAGANREPQRAPEGLKGAARIQWHYNQPKG